MLLLKLLLFCLALPLVLVACVERQLTPLPPESTITPLPPSPTPTATIVWFPATSTPTLFPTPVLTPTVDVRPQVGDTLFSDDFSEDGGWTLGKQPPGSAAIGAHALTLHIDRQEGYLYSLRQATDLKDFYLEITASPGICRDGDEYGLLLRVSSSLDFYRFSLNCSGQFRVDKYFKNAASSPKPLTTSGAIPPGAPSQSRLAVWASGRDIHFFANDQLLFSLHDPSLSSGTLGLFARASGEDEMTVSFSELIVKEVVK